MAHEVESMFSVAETPWHGLGTVLRSAPTPGEAIVAAGLDWTVEERDLFCKAGSADVTERARGAVKLAGHRALVRSTDSAVLGVVGDRYQAVQNVDAFAWFQPWLDANAATLETAGSLRGGSRVWILAKIVDGTAEVVKNDPVNAYILLSNAHDGSMCVRAGLSAIRVVCANTLALAHADKASKLIRIRHTASVGDALAAVRNSMDLVRGTFSETLDGYQAMSRKGISEKDLKKYIKVVFGPSPADERPATGSSVASVVAEALAEAESEGKRLENRIVPLFTNGRGNDRPLVRGTVWAAYNAVTEYLTHERGGANNRDTRLDSGWFGNGAATNTKAYKAAIALAAALPYRLGLAPLTGGYT